MKKVKKVSGVINLEKGSVTPFGILNNAGCNVEIAFDSDSKKFEYVAVHPNQNTATVFLAFDDLAHHRKTWKYGCIYHILAVHIFTLDQA